MEPYQENIGDEEEFQINIQSKQSLQLVTYGQGHCPARAEHSGESMSPLGIIFIARQKIPINIEPSPFLIISQKTWHPSCQSL